MAVLESPQKDSNCIDSEDLQHRKLTILANCNPYHKASESVLLNYYTEIRKTWSKSAIDNLKSQYKLKLNSKRGRCFFARLVAKVELNNVQPVIPKIEAFAPLTAGFIGDLVSNSYEIGNKFPKMLVKDSIIGNGNNDFCNSDHLSESLQFSDQDDSLQQKLIAKERELQDLQEQLLTASANAIAQQQQLELTEAKLQEKSIANEQLERQLTEKDNQLNKQVKLNIIVATDRLLPAGPPLNGVQESPAFKILGSPKTLTELDYNYENLKKLLSNKINKYRRAIIELRLHPDLSQDNDEDGVEAIAQYRAKKDETKKRLDLVESSYNIHHDNWDLLKPTIPISDEELQMRMNVEIPNGWTAESFWE